MWTTKEHLCNNCSLCQAQSFFSYLLSLMNHEQLARNYFNYMNQWRNTCFLTGRTSLLVPLQKSINALWRALGFKRKSSSKSIITSSNSSEKSSWNGLCKETECCTDISTTCQRGCHQHLSSLDWYLLCTIWAVLQFWCQMGVGNSCCEENPATRALTTACSCTSSNAA